jgi:hypothetical protein
MAANQAFIGKMTRIGAAAMCVPPGRTLLKLVVITTAEVTAGLFPGDRELSSTRSLADACAVLESKKVKAPELESSEALDRVTTGCGGWEGQW